MSLFEAAVPNDTYRVVLKFAEIFISAPTVRRFHIMINGQYVALNFDITHEAGGPFIAIDKDYIVPVTNGRITVQLFISLYGPIISALEILPVPQTAASVAAPVAPLRLTAAQPQARAASDMDAAGFTPILLDAERCGAVSYEFTVPNNIYTVRLRFVELTRRGAGERFFHVLINGHYVLLNFDIVAQAGGPGKAINREFNISVTNRILKIDFQSVIGEPVIDGIEIVPYEAPEVECVVLPRALTGAGGHGG